MMSEIVFSAQSLTSIYFSLRTHSGFGDGVTVIALSVTAIILRMPFSEMCFGIFGTPEVTRDVGHSKISFKEHFGPPQKSGR